MRTLVITLLIICVILIIIYHTKVGQELAEKTNNTITGITDTVVDLYTDDVEKIYQETGGDNYDLKAKTVLKKLLTIPDEKRTAFDNYRIGNIYRYHIKNPNLTHHYYRIALQKMRNKPRTGTVQMLDRIQDYDIFDAHIARDIPEIRELIAEDMLVRQLGALGDAVIPRHTIVELPPPQLFQQPRDPHVSQVPPTPIKVGLSPQLANLTNHVKILGEKNKEKFFNNIQTWTSDTQNVHDSHMTNDTVKTYRKITEGLNPRFNPDHEINEMIIELDRLKKNNKISPIKHSNAMRTIISMKTGHEHSKIGDNEKNILANIWRRMNIPENKPHRNDLLISLTDNLSNSVERNNVANTPVCITGRVSDALSCFAHIDRKDSDVGILKTKEAVRNEVFQTAHHEYKKTLDTALANTDIEPTLKKGAEDSKKGEDTPESIQFENMVKKNIETRLKQDFGKHIEEKELEGLIAQSQMAF